MALEWTHCVEGLDWDELEALYRAAPLGNKKAADLKVAFTNSMFKCLVFDGGRLVAAGRAVADGVDCAYLCDVAVLPSHQGQGLGKALVARLLDLSQGHKKVILYAVPGKEPLYHQLGFRRMTTAMAIFQDQARALERGLLTEN